MEEQIGNFWCENCNCSAEGREKNFSLPFTRKTENKTKCPNNTKKVLKCLGTQFGKGIIIASKHKSGRTDEEKRIRSTRDFKKNVLPTLPPDEKRYFKKKYEKQKKLGIKQ